MLRRLPILLVLLLPISAAAQFGFEYRPLLAPVLASGDTLRLAWSGGLNSPQYSSIDLNGDGQNDLFVFERTQNRVLTYLSVAAPRGGRRWQYAPAYESLFPTDLTSWALLRDYDCDGRPDLWTQGALGGDIRVLRNVAGNGGRPTFQLTTAMLNFFNSPSLSGNINLNGYDIPAIQDVDGDGKLDILAFDYVVGSQVQYFRNTSATCGGLTYRWESSNWAGFTFCGSTCTDYVTSGNMCRPNRIQHTGGFGLLLQDFDNDGDQDLLLSRDQCAELVGIRNTGTATTATTNASSRLLTLPNGIGAVSIDYFPVPYAIDANQDGKLDLVLGSGLVNNDDRVSMRHNGALFLNNGTSTTPDYARQTGGFLQEQMIDVSEGAASVFGDLDSDGDLDMLVANTGDQYGTPMTSADYRATLSFYRNVGTAQQPVFSLVTDDYLGLSVRNFTYLRPVLTDLNRDGKPDLAFAAQYIGAPFIFYYLNTATIGQSARFDTSQLNNLNLPGVTAGNTPCFADVDGDGYLDLLLGSNRYNTSGQLEPLRYFRRSPNQPLDDAFMLVDNDFGRFRTPSNDRPQNLAPAVADVDGDGMPDLLAIDHTGTLHLVTNYRAQSGIFNERTDVIRNVLTGQLEAPHWGNTYSSTKSRNHLSLADLNGDGAPELIVGTNAGGLLLYAGTGRVLSSRSKAAQTLQLQVYPNPAQDQVNVETPNPSRVVVRDLLGRVVQQDNVLLRRRLLNLAALSAGVYLLEATDANGLRGLQRVQVK
jgi:Secretion system C-terminal sorting domain/FG-GAP-like repeat